MSLVQAAEVLAGPTVSTAADAGEGGQTRDSRRTLDTEPADPAQFAGLISRCLDGDQDAFAQLVEACAARLYNFLLRFAGNTHDAEDLAQETFLKAYRNLDRFDTSRPFLPWLFTIARRTALNHLRGLRPTEELSDDLVAGADGASVSHTSEAVEALATRDDSDRLWRLARRLKPNQYQALWLRYGEGLELPQVAVVMRTNALYVRVLLHRARRALLELARRAGMDESVLSDT